MAPRCRWIYTAFCIKATLSELLRTPGVMFSISYFSAAKPEHANDIFGGVSGKEFMKQSKQTIR